MRGITKRDAACGIVMDRNGWVREACLERTVQTVDRSVLLRQTAIASLIGSLG